jgi:hypothetical protein
MHYLRVMAVGVMQMFILAACLPACEPEASCKEACDKDDDCETGLACLATVTGNLCLPAECTACFESGRTCYHSENLSEQAEGESLMCEFTECG